MPQVLLNTEATHPMLGNLLDDRYQIIQVLSSDTFGRTYIAEDTRSSGNPKCVIKHIKPVSNEPQFWQSARHHFISKTQKLTLLGEHDRIPQVLTYFENDRGFYLVQQFIQGQPLSALLPTSQRCGKRWNQKQVIQLVQEVLGTLEFVSTQGFIHCNIKPNNIIKRALDGKFCLIGFGAIQPVQTPSANIEEQADVILSLQPAGYIPVEQLAYQPQPNSDIYALGAIAIQALSGLHPTQLQLNPDRKWYEQVRVDKQLVCILNQMVRYRSQDRYQSATEALQAIQYLDASSQESKVCGEELQPAVQELEPPDKDLNSISEEMPDISSNPFAQESEQIIDSVENSLPESSLESLTFVTPPIEIIQEDATSEYTQKPAETTAKSEASKPVSKSRKLPGILTAFGVGIVANALVAAAGFFYISEPDQAKFKDVDRFISQVQLEEKAKQVCQIPHICFWEKKQQPAVAQGKAKTKAEVHKHLQEAFQHAAKRDFTGALKHLEQISPQAPDYAKVKTKMTEYRQKQRIKEQVERMAKSN